MFRDVSRVFREFRVWGFACFADVSRCFTSRSHRLEAVLLHHRRQHRPRGQTVILAFALLKYEDEAQIEWAFRCFGDTFRVACEFV